MERINMIQKTIILFLAYFCFVISAFAQECKEIRVAGNFDWLPVAFVNENTNEPEGIAHDFIKLIGEKLQIPVSINTELPWKRMLSYLEKGQIDMSVAIYKNQEREKKFMYSLPYFVNESRVFVLKDKAFQFEKFEDLFGLVGGISLGTSFGDEFDTFIKNNKIKLEGVTTKEQRFGKLISKRNDFTIQDHLDGMLYLKKTGLQNKVIALPHPISTTEVYFAFSLKSSCIKLVPKINEIIQHSKKNGTLQMIIDKYIDV